MLGLSKIILFENKGADLGLREVAHVLQILEGLEEHHSDLVLVELVIEMFTIAFLDDVLEEAIHLHDVDITAIELANLQQYGTILLLERYLLDLELFLLLQGSRHLLWLLDLKWLNMK